MIAQLVCVELRHKPTFFLPKAMRLSPRSITIPFTIPTERWAPRWQTHISFLLMFLMSSIISQSNSCVEMHVERINETDKSCKTVLKQIPNSQGSTFKGWERRSSEGVNMNCSWSSSYLHLPFISLMSPFPLYFGLAELYQVHFLRIASTTAQIASNVLILLSPFSLSPFSFSTMQLWNPNSLKRIPSGLIRQEENYKN